MYSITAQVHRITEDGWNMSRDIPTFYLDENVQGIVDEDHATAIALTIIDPWNQGNVTVLAIKVS